ncbi:MAG: hypothetical protein AB7R90_10990 [Reyranellaceae bacterium]
MDAALPLVGHRFWLVLLGCISALLPQFAYAQTFREIPCNQSRLMGPADVHCVATGYYSSLEGGNGRFRSYAIAGSYESGSHKLIYSASLMIAEQESAIRGASREELSQIIQNYDQEIAPHALDWSVLLTAGSISYRTFRFHPPGGAPFQCFGFSLLSGGNAYGYGRSLLGNMCRSDTRRFEPSEVSAMVSTLTAK